MVVLNHMGYGGHNLLLPDILRHGSTGVDLFFVISGFVITRSALSMIDHLTFGQFLRDFMIKRVFKIVPVALAWVAFFCAAFWIASVLGGFRFPANIPPEVNWIMTLRYNYMAPGQGSLAFGHYWSLMVEEHFYLIFAPLFPYLIRRKLLVPAAIVGIVAVTFWLRPYAFSPQYTHARFDGLLVGALIAYLLPAGIPLPRIVATIASAALIFAVWICFSFKVPNAYSVVALLSGALVVIAAANANVILPVGRLRPALTWIGERSYSIYLSHPLVIYGEQFGFVALQKKFGLDVPMILRSILLMAVILLVGHLSYRFIERPSVEAGRRWLTRKETLQTQPA